MPDWYIAANVAMTEIGIETATIAVLRPSRRKTNRTRVARIPPTTAEDRTWLTLPVMKRDWSKTGEASTPAGYVGSCFIASSRSATDPHTVTVLASPSLKTAISTLSLPLKRATISRSLDPRQTRATSSSTIFRPAWSAMTMPRTSSIDRNSLTMRTM